MLLGAVAACSSSSLVVKSELDRSVNFDTYETFAIAEDAGELKALATDGYDVGFIGGTVASDLKQMVNQTIVQELGKRGMELAREEDADLLITYIINIGVKPEVVAPDYRRDTWSSEAELGGSTVAQGTLVVDFLDPERAEARSYLVWRGWASGQVDPQAVRERRGQRLNSALKKILARYPN